MLDDLTVAADGEVILQEDMGNQSRLSKMWVYDPKTDALTEAAQHDPARFGTPPVAPFNRHVESSGVVEVTDLFPRDPEQRRFLVDTQAHYAFGAEGSAKRQEIVQGGQLMLMTVNDFANFGSPDQMYA